jgi:hypothetical protein
LAAAFAGAVLLAGVVFTAGLAGAFVEFVETFFAAAGLEAAGLEAAVFTALLVPLWVAAALLPLAFFLALDIRTLLSSGFVLTRQDFGNVLSSRAIGARALFLSI